MMTLVLITLLMGIVALALGQSEKLSREGNRLFYQSASLRLLDDLEQQLPSLLSAITGAEELDLAMRLPLQIESKKRDFTLTANLSSPYGRWNINSLSNGDGKVNEANLALFMKLFATYPIADADIFIKLVLDTIDTDNSERSTDTEIALSHPDFKNGVIGDAKQFNLIVERYIELTKDTAILSIPWDRYIGYEGDKMDFNALTPEVLSLVLPTLSPEKIRTLTQFRTKAFVSKEEVVAAEPSLGALFDTYFFIYKSGVSYDLMCDVRIRENSHDEHMKFRYNLVDKRVKNVTLL